MGLVRVSGFTVSVDGFGAGPDQTRETPLGVGGEELHTWMVGTRTFMGMIGRSGGTTGVDDDLVSGAMSGVGAWIMGRNMFTWSRGPWPNDDWRGWWGKNPPYHSPVFVLTHHQRPSLPMEGGTEFFFETGGIHRALERAREVAGDRDIRVLGGVSVIRQFVTAGFVDHMHFAVSPRFLGRGENLFHGLDFEALGYKVTRHISTPDALHVFLDRA
ncbi:MAG TPA: dihydrofolate reductase family protein [Longimicrobiales bacterium]